jgi:hypothetical protein
MFIGRRPPSISPAQSGADIGAGKEKGPPSIGGEDRHRSYTRMIAIMALAKKIPRSRR